MHVKKTTVGAKFLVAIMSIFLVKNYNFFSLIDHIIRIADIRKFNEPVLSLHGHKKAVSYVQFLTEKELVSA